VVSRPSTPPPPVSVGGIIVTRNPAPVIVSSSQVAFQSDPAGLVTLQPPAGGAQEAIVIQGTSAAGTSVLPFLLQSLTPVSQPALGTARPANTRSLQEYGVRPVPIAQPRE
jgi:hypothetical protein